jgi:hypothetical protein
MSIFVVFCSNYSTMDTCVMNDAFSACVVNDAFSAKWNTYPMIFFLPTKCTPSTPPIVGESTSVTVDNCSSPFDSLTALPDEAPGFCTRCNSTDANLVHINTSIM